MKKHLKFVQGLEVFKFNVSVFILLTIYVAGTILFNIMGVQITWYDVLLIYFLTIGCFINTTWASSVGKDNLCESVGSVEVNDENKS